jgi:hypothetical protein
MKKTRGRKSRETISLNIQLYRMWCVICVCMYISGYILCVICVQYVLCYLYMYANIELYSLWCVIGVQYVQYVYVRLYVVCAGWQACQPSPSTTSGSRRCAGWWPTSTSPGLTSSPG